jgi:hypothetical protein
VGDSATGVGVSTLSRCVRSASASGTTALEVSTRPLDAQSPHGSGPCGGGRFRDNGVTTNVGESGDTGGSSPSWPRCERPGEKRFRAFGSGPSPETTSR